MFRTRRDFKQLLKIDPSATVNIFNVFLRQINIYLLNNISELQS